MDEIIELCKKIARCLMEEDYDFLHKSNALSRVSEQDIKRVLKEYEGCLTPIPDKAFDSESKSFHVFKYNDNSGYKIDMDLWTDGEWSDLTLQMEVKVNINNEISSFAILDLLVM